VPISVYLFRPRGPWRLFMSPLMKTTLGLCLMAFPALVMGCGKASEDPEVSRRKNDLVQIYEMYSVTAKNTQKPPKQLSDLNRKAMEPLYPEGMRGLQSGQYIVVWGTPTSKDSQAVLAYEKDAPQNGGMVLLGDGSMKHMAADQLNAALKAKG